MQLIFAFVFTYAKNTYAKNMFSHNADHLVNFGFTVVYIFLAHLSRRLVGDLIVYPWSGVCRRQSSTISNMNNSATSEPITMKFYQKHHWDGGRLN